MQVKGVLRGKTRKLPTVDSTGCAHELRRFSRIVHSPVHKRTLRRAGPINSVYPPLAAEADRAPFRAGDGAACHPSALQLGQHQTWRNHVSIAHLGLAGETREPRDQRSDRVPPHDLLAEQSAIG